MVSAGQNYVFFGTGAFSYRIKYSLAALFKIYLVFFYTLMWTVSIGKGIFFPCTLIFFSNCLKVFPIL